jgi:hypothetical protein
MERKKASDFPQELLNLLDGNFSTVHRNSLSAA